MANTIILPHHISKSFIQQHPEWVFIYGKDFCETGMMGQMWVAHGEPNCFGIPTCTKLCPSNKQYLNDYSALHLDRLVRALADIPRDGRPIHPIRRIGMGCSRMFELAPTLYKFMITELDLIRHKDVEVVCYPTN